MSKEREAFPLIVLSRAIMDKPRSDEQVFVSKWMTNLRLLLIVIGAVFFVGLVIWYPFGVFILFLPSLYVFPVQVNAVFQGGRDIIVVFPGGLAQIKKGRLGAKAFSADENWKIKWSSWIDGTTCQVREGQTQFTVSARFRKHREIAEYIVDAFKTWHAQH